jgi:hypothetical protein
MAWHSYRHPFDESHPDERWCIHFRMSGPTKVRWLLDLDGTHYCPYCLRRDA